MTDRQASLIEERREKLAQLTERWKSDSNCVEKVFKEYGYAVTPETLSQTYQYMPDTIIDMILYDLENLKNGGRDHDK